jgi:hypothetical protein
MNFVCSVKVLGRKAALSELKFEKELIEKSKVKAAFKASTLDFFYENQLDLNQSIKD